MRKGDLIMLTPYLIFLLSMTFITSIIYSYDFAVAVGQWDRYNRPRIPEYILLTLAALGGGFGGWIAMKVQRHKASMRSFRFVIRFSIIMNLIVLTTLIVSDFIGG